MQTRRSRKTFLLQPIHRDRGYALLVYLAPSSRTEDGATPLFRALASNLSHSCWNANTVIVRIRRRYGAVDRRHHHHRHALATIREPAQGA